MQPDIEDRTLSDLYAALQDANAHLFRAGRVCVEPQLAVALRCEIGMLSAEIRKRLQEGARHESDFVETRGLENRQSEYHS